MGYESRRTPELHFASRGDDDDRSLWDHDPSPLDADAADFRFTVADRDHNAGSRENIIYRWGYNPKARDASGVAEASVDGFSFADVLETHFEPSTPGEGQFERYMSWSDGTDEFRPFSMTVTKDDRGAGDWDAHVGILGNTVGIREATTGTILKRADFNFVPDPVGLVQLKDLDLTLQAQSDRLTDDSGLDSPTLTLRGLFDSDVSGTISPSSLQFQILAQVQHNGGAGEHNLLIVNDSGQEMMRFEGETRFIGINRGNPNAMLEISTLDSEIGLLVQPDSGATPTRSAHFAGEVLVGGDLNHDGSGVGFFGTAPAAQTVNAAFGNAANTGDAGTDALIEALKDAVVDHGLGST